MEARWERDEIADKRAMSERGGSNRNANGDEIADERARSEEQHPQQGFCDERRESEEKAELLNYEYIFSRRLFSSYIFGQQYFRHRYLVNHMYVINIL